MNSALLSADPDLFSWDQADCVPMLGAIYSQKTYRPQAFRRVDIPKPNASDHGGSEAPFRFARLWRRRGGTDVIVEIEAIDRRQGSAPRLSHTGAIRS
jgi:hypothetical protein